MSSAQLEATPNPNTSEQQEAMNTSSQISYLVPKAAVFQQFAQQVGEQMAESYTDPRYAEQAVVDGASGRKTVYERLAVAKRKVLVAIQSHFVIIADSNYRRDAILKARHAAGETLSSLGRDFGLTPQRVFQIVNSGD